MAAPGRTADGKFAPGHKSRGGRPPKEREKNYQKAFNETVKLADWVAIIKTAVKDAKKGNATARAWLTQWLCGSPEQWLTLGFGNQGGQEDDAARMSELTDEEFLALAANLEVKLGITKAEPTADSPKPRRRKRPQPTRKEA